MKYNILFLIGALALKSAAFAADGTTVVKISVPEKESKINPMIYGQMLEDCNDKIIYGGLIRDDGSEHPKVAEFLKPLDIPIMRWPAGTYIHEYDWKKGIGAMEKRPQVACHVWGGVETNQFGTDEFLKWCKKMNIEPYINFNMGNDIKVGGTLGEAIDWVDYVNGGVDTMWGKRRAENGHPEPYGVKYWCIGNENYGPWGKHTAETKEVYAKKFNRWAAAIKSLYPELIFLGVGHTLPWNEYILDNCGKDLDILTLHFYVSIAIDDGKVKNPNAVLFAPAKIEGNIEKNIELLNKANAKFNRADNPITLSVDEWNNRHKLPIKDKKSKIDRQDTRRLFDAAIVAGMLNVYIRQSPYVSMANYIFPVNGHGLIRTNGDEDAFKTTLYPIFELYRKIMLGVKLDAAVDGPRSDADVKKFTIDGDINSVKELHGKKFTYVDSAATLDNAGNINVSLINRSYESSQKAKIEVPQGYVASEAWEISADDINAANFADDRERVVAKHKSLNAEENQFEIKPCATVLVRFVKK